MKHPILSMALGVIALSHGLPSAKGPQRRFTVTLAVPQTTVKSGEKILLTITLRNDLQRDIYIEGFIGSPEFSYAINVRGEGGKKPPETRYGMALHGEDSGSPRMVFAPSGGIRELRPAETITGNLEVTKIYDMAKPGK